MKISIFLMFILLSVLQCVFGEVIQRTRVVYEKIPYKIIVYEDREMQRWEEKVIQKGKVGKRKREILETIENGKIVNVKEIKSTVLIEPQDRIIVEGTRFDLPHRGARIEKKLTVIATAYYPECCGSQHNLTKMGIRAQKGVVAVDPKVIPLGSILYIPSYGYAKASDIGSKIKGNRIDICFDTKEEALNYGKKKIEVFIVR